MGNIETTEEFNKLKRGGTVELIVDPIDDALEELAAIAVAWQKNRDRNKPSPILRRAIISAAQELVDNVSIYYKQQADEEKESLLYNRAAKATAKTTITPELTA